MKLSNLTLLIAFGFAVILSSCNSEESKPDYPDSLQLPHNGMSNFKNATYLDNFETVSLNSNSKLAAEASNNFTFRLFHDLNGNYSDVNNCVSPYSAFVALSMLANGDKGDTKEEILKTLRIDENSSIDSLNSYNSQLYKTLSSYGETLRCNISNSIWIIPDLMMNPSFSDIMQNVFGAYSGVSDFSTDYGIQKVNGWIEDSTNGIIKNFFNHTIPDATMIVANAVYFKGDWKVPFSKKLTQTGAFTTINGETEEVEMICGGSEYFKYYSNTEFDMVGIPYDNDNYEMDLILPKDSDFGYCLGGFSLSRYKEILASEINDYDIVSIEFPKFKVETEMSLGASLRRLGINTIFNKSNGFSDMILSDEPLYINDMLQKSVLNVDESGTVGASATATTMWGASDNHNIKSFNIQFNRPFIYLIREVRSGVIIFIGKITDF